MNTYRQEFRLDDGVLYVRLTGEFPVDLLQDERNVFQPLIEACAKYESRNILIDATELEVNLQTMELFRAGQDAASLARLGLRIALLTTGVPDPFFEDVAVNRGARLRVFTDNDAARAWLRGA